MANDTNPLVDPPVTVAAALHPAPRPAPPSAPPRRRRPARRWSLVLFVIEVAIAVALVWFSWSSGSWA